MIALGRGSLLVTMTTLTKSNARTILFMFVAESNQVNRIGCCALATGGLFSVVAKRRCPDIECPQMPFENLAKASRLTWRLMRITMTNPRGLRNVLGTALAASENHLSRSSDPTRLPRITLEELLESAPGGMKMSVFFRPKIGFKQPRTAQRGPSGI
jgi:hypothetical protein